MPPRPILGTGADLAVSRPVTGFGWVRHVRPLVGGSAHPCSIGATGIVSLSPRSSYKGPGDHPMVRKTRFLPRFFVVRFLIFDCGLWIEGRAVEHMASLQSKIQNRSKIVCLLVQLVLRHVLERPAGFLGDRLEQGDEVGVSVLVVDEGDRVDLDLLVLVKLPDLLENGLV